MPPLQNIEEVLALTVDEALEFFAGDAKVAKLLRPMCEVGLGYLTLGQPTSTCSGGEVQRIKLSSELGKRGNVYVLDEPSTGLHARDVEVLAGLLDRLVDGGNTVVCIEHRMELVARADWVIDLGPEGGNAGGEVVFCGTPAALLECEASKTGRYLLSAALADMSARSGMPIVEPIEAIAAKTGVTGSQAPAPATAGRMSRSEEIGGNGGRPREIERMSGMR